MHWLLKQPVLSTLAAKILHNNICQNKHIAWLGAINCKFCLGHVYIDSMDRLICLTQLGEILHTFFLSWQIRNVLF